MCIVFQMTDGLFATLRDNSHKVSAYLMDNINHFGSNGGFDAIISLLKVIFTKMLSIMIIQYYEHLLI